MDVDQVQAQSEDEEIDLQTQQEDKEDHNSEDDQAELQERAKKGKSQNVEIPSHNSQASPKPQLVVHHNPPLSLWLLKLVKSFPLWHVPNLKL
ncbi:hypothetical protein M422DRAFT_257913 [Sphaerobolus stellatus SS14]|uniref:Uncharacterized protein n=1 Tax=Sphaerobolus stellatus (strain SS14) TaxID=990650 RepID=A0A0C9VCT7_SPHS4|nr:hypothetical protein M422DRAFT_257913 [Sphaerobolus stellatus SS14]